MALGEFALIERFFKRPARRAVVGVGDDCAVWQPNPGMQLAISTDMLVEGRHFFPDVDPFFLGHKALAVNLSDLAACGATPAAFTLALSMPKVNEAWLAAFAQGLFALADAHDCELIGGDTTQGPLNICITVLGEVPAGLALLRSGAKTGDDVYVSGTLGDARLALLALQGQLRLSDDALAMARQRLEQPTPRVALGMALRGVASSAIDLSDGLAGDLGHVLAASGCGATLNTQALSHLLQLGDPALPAPTQPISAEQALGAVLNGGDDYELLFTAPVFARDAVAQAALTSTTRVTRIGQIDAASGLRLVDAQGLAVHGEFASFDHFA